MAVTIKQWRDVAEKKLQEQDIPSPRLDAEIILAHTLSCSRTYLHAYPEQTLTSHQRDIADARLGLRLERVPIAYIIGHKDFYGRRFRVTTATLIPRPESELLISMLSRYVQRGKELRYVDVGTGSGCLGITAKLEHPELDVTLIDISQHALTVAEKNARLLHADVHTIRSDLLATYPFTIDILMANLPYVDRDWSRSPETNHEPEVALFASSGGLDVIHRLIMQAQDRLTPNGYMFLEADPRQFDAVSQYAEQHGFTSLETEGFCLVFQRVNANTK